MFFFGLCFSCFLKKLMRSTMAVPVVALTRSTFPCLPRSLPERTTTVSPFFTCDLFGRGSSLCVCDVLPYIPIGSTSDDFRRERDDLHELALAELAGDRSEDTRPDRLARIVDENGRVVVELDIGAVTTAAFLDRADDDGLHDRPLLDGAVWRRLFDRRRDDVAEARVTAGGRAAQHLDAGDLLGAGVVSDLQNRSHLNHREFLQILRLRLRTPSPGLL